MPLLKLPAGDRADLAMIVSLQVVFRPEAEGEALEVRHWCESRSHGLGEQFSQALASVISRITEAPLAFPAVHGETRRSRDVRWMEQSDA